MSINSIFQGSLLAEAAYADFESAKEDGAFNEAKVKTALKNIGGEGEGFSAAQATEFTDHWTVVSHQPNTLSGFSATLFESKDNPGQFSLAIRGTEELTLTSWSGWNDLLRTDLADALADGVAISQAIDLFNYYQDLTAVSGEPVIHYSYQKEIVDLYGTITPAQINTVNTGLATATGKLSGQNFNVVGHSLGGHLAMIMSRFAPSAVSEVSTFNTLGVGVELNVQSFFDLLRDASSAPIGTDCENQGVSQLEDCIYNRNEDLPDLNATPRLKEPPLDNQPRQL